jgi:hypothetical protein
VISNVMCQVRCCFSRANKKHTLKTQRDGSHKLRPMFPSINLGSRLAGLLLLLLLCVPVQAQLMEGGFVIQPMIVDVPVEPGLNQFDLVLENQSRTDTQIVTLKVVELTQAPDSSWLPLEDLSNVTGISDFDVSKHNSCKDWLQIDAKKARTTLKPFEQKPVSINIRVPGGKRGFYCAGVVATLHPRPGSTGVRLTYEFVVPILLRIEGSVLFNKVKLADANMKLRQKSKDKPEASLVSFEVRNEGETQAAIQVSGQLRAFAEGRWKNISRFDFQPQRIIPGACLKFERDYGKSLPAGRYKLSAVTYVNGQRSRGIEKEIQYAGQKNAGALTEAVAIEFDPELLQIDCKPRIKRSGKMAIYNNSNESVRVKLSIQMPTHMQNTTYGGLRCDTLGCPDWLSVRPEEFELRAFKERNAQVIAQMPEEAQLYANYYADLVVDYFYPDGSRAGQTRAAVCVNNIAVVHEPSFREIGEELEKFGESQYVVKAAFFNQGDTHINPEVTARVVNPGLIVVRNVEMKTNANLSTLMMPFEKRTFFARLDFSDIPAGQYNMRIDYTFDGLERAGVINKQINVRLAGEQRIVEGFTDAKGTQAVGKVGAQWK